MNLNFTQQFKGQLCNFKGPQKVTKFQNKMKKCIEIKDRIQEKEKKQSLNEVIGLINR